MKSMTSDELRRQALAMGAEAVIDGKTFNSGRAQVQAAPAPKPAPVVALVPPAPAPAEPTFSRADVERLLAEQERRFTAQITALAEIVKASTRSAPGAVPEGFKPEYGRDGEITFVGVQYRQLQ